MHAASGFCRQKPLSAGRRQVSAGLNPKKPKCQYTGTFMTGFPVYLVAQALYVARLCIFSASTQIKTASVRPRLDKES